MPRGRTVVSREELEQWLTNELQKIEDCEECSVGGIMPLREPDEDGCNWSGDVVVSSGGVPVEYFRPYLARIMREARNRFNIRDD